MLIDAFHCPRLHFATMNIGESFDFQRLNAIRLEGARIGIEGILSELNRSDFKWDCES